MSEGMPLMSRKSGPRELKQTLGLFDAAAISVGAIIGAGIFVVTGIAAAAAGPALVISMLIAAAVSLFTALSIAQLAAWQPKEGSIYEYAYQLVSPFAGFLVGWMWMISNVFAGAAVSLGFAHYLAGWFPFLPAAWTAPLVCLGFTAVNYFGVRQSARLNNVIVVAKLLILAFFAVFGLLHIKTANFVPFASSKVGVLYGACFIFFAYGGFARVAIVAEEIRDAKRNVPRAIMISLAVSTAVYLVVGVVAVGLVGAPVLAASKSPLTRAVAATGSGPAASVVSTGALLATAGVLLTSILGVSRMAYAMARRQDLPGALSRLHPKYHTPGLAVWLTGALMTLLILTADLSRVVTVSTFALLFYYTIANLSALRMEAADRLYPRSVSVLGAVSCLVLSIFIFFAAREAWLIGVAVLAAGALLYAMKKAKAGAERSTRAL